MQLFLAGHEIVIELTESGEDYLPSPCASFGLQLNIDDSVNLTAINRERSDDAPEWFPASNWWDAVEDEEE